MIVEVSGVGDPRTVAQWGRTPGFTLDAVVVLADAETVRERAADRYVGETVVTQLAGADLVVVTHLDVLEHPAAHSRRSGGGWARSPPLRSSPAQLHYGTTTHDPYP